MKRSLSLSLSGYVAVSMCLCVCVPLVVCVCPLCLLLKAPLSTEAPSVTIEDIAQYVGVCVSSLFVVKSTLKH